MFIEKLSFHININDRSETLRPDKANKHYTQTKKIK